MPRRCPPEVRRLELARRVAPAGVDPEDLVQDTPERAWRSAATAKHDHPRAWLRTVLHNRANDLNPRQRVVRFEALEDATPDLAEFSVNDPDTVARRVEQYEELRRGLSPLPLPERMAVALHDGESWSAADVASISGCSVEAAHKRIQRGRVRLAKRSTVQASN